MPHTAEKSIRDFWGLEETDAKVKKGGRKRWQPRGSADGQDKNNMCERARSAMLTSPHTHWDTFIQDHIHISRGSHHNVEKELKKASCQFHHDPSINYEQFTSWEIHLGELRAVRHKRNRARKKDHKAPYSNGAPSRVPSAPTAPCPSSLILNYLFMPL